MGLFVQPQQRVDKTPAGEREREKGSGTESAGGDKRSATNIGHSGGLPRGGLPGVRRLVTMTTVRETALVFPLDCALNVPSGRQSQQDLCPKSLPVKSSPNYNYRPGSAAGQTPQNEREAKKFADQPSWLSFRRIAIGSNSWKLGVKDATSFFTL